jgi:hypothetical protein
MVIPVNPPSIFDDLDALRLPSDVSAYAGTRELLTRVPVKKPSDMRDFIRIHPDPNMALPTAIFEDKDAGETFIVLPAMAAALVGNTKLVKLQTAISRGGIVFLWPIPLPDQSGRSNDWNESQRIAAIEANKRWIRMQSDRTLGAYRVYSAEGEIPDPVWPDMTLSALLEIAFRGRLVDRPDHAVIRRIRGL